MAIRIGAREARNNFAELLGRVHYGGNTVILERAGKPMAAVIPFEVYNRLVAGREDRFRLLDRIRNHMPDVPEEELQQDVADAISAARTGDAPRRP